ncbi:MULTISPECIES: winged helix-turn-helix transcriptional regulator [Haloprofundus]|uniref:winged helix-turn-helix transcriptional regulator n=1 Tax=Haloprofundus TaxID=1911573 RepID=UPI000E43B366|nr:MULTISPECIES: winged helix-turn-helix transcriptional regulator [Haloprofundus]QCJ47516.1 winged helix-turn-helix transcriptional regulator [Haloprofundus sp. MHR1]
MSDRVDEEKRATLRRFAALGAAVPFARLDETDDESRSDVRDAIVGYLSTTPGAHFSKVRDDLRLGTGETQHHLDKLLSEGVVLSRRDGDYRRFFPAQRFSEFEQVALGYLRRDTPRKMLLELLRDPDATGVQLADAADVSTATVSSYRKQLEGAGLLAAESGLSVERPETLIMLLVRYADSFGAETIAFANEAYELVEYNA